MASYEYAGEKIITITNTAVDLPIDDGGTRPNTEGNKVIPADRFVQFYGKNLWVKLASGDVLTVKAITSAEIAFYVGQATAEITVEVADVPVDESVENPG